MIPKGENSKENGSALVELAFVLPILLVILAGATELSRAFYAAYEVTNASRAGLQWAAVNFASASNSTSIQTAATNDAPDLNGVAAVATAVCKCDDGTSVSCTSGTCTLGAVRQYVSVTTSFSFMTLGTYPYIPRPMNLQNTSTMRVK